MSVVSRDLPERPHLDIPKREARELLELWRSGAPDAFERIKQRHPKFRRADNAALAAGPFLLADAQLVIAREYTFSSWTQLKLRIEGHTAMQEMKKAIRANDRDTAIRLIEQNPDLLHVPVVNGNWGPPMSHAANLGHLDIIKAMAALGATDFQHAFGRAVLQGQIECARWLRQHGAKVDPGSLMGACEAHDVAGVRFMAELQLAFTDERGDRLAPLAMVLETYSRNHVDKHAILDIFATQGYEIPDTPTMALHRGDIAALKRHLRNDPGLLERTFTMAEIYPAECGCSQQVPFGMHWTPIQGTTLLHLAIDFRERDVFDWLIAQGADVNARAAVDDAGFGGHTPLFNSVLRGPWPDASMTRDLLARGADKNIRANVRKFLDWNSKPRWHEARDVTAAEWARGFPDQSWVDGEALRLLGA